MSFIFSQPAPGIVPTDSISFVELEKVGSTSVLGNTSGSPADAESITFQDLTQDHLTLFNDTEQGLVPASGGGTSTFLRADGSWATAGISTAGALDQQVLAYDSGTGLTTWQYAGLGDGSFGANTIVLGTSLGSLLPANRNIYISTVPCSASIDNCVIVGNMNALSNTTYLTAIGQQTQNVGFYGTAVGWGSRVCEGGTAVGWAATAGSVGVYNNERCTAIGSGATCDQGIDSTAVGHQANARKENSVSIGRLAYSYGANNTVVGAYSGSSSLTGTNNTILGQGSATSLTTGTSNVIIGKGTATLATTLGTAFSTGNVIIGNEAMTAATNPEGSVVIGFQAATSTVANWTTIIGSLAGSGAAFGDSAVAVGHRSHAGQNSTAIGTNATTGSNAGSVAIGQGASAGIQAVALGRQAAASDNTFAVGSNNAKINTVFFGRGGDDIGTGTGAHPVTISCSRVQTGWSNVSGVAGTLTLNGANSTGNQPGGDVIIQTAPAGASGSTANAYVEVMRVTADSRVGIGTSTPSAKLDVNGDILAGEFKVTKSGIDYRIDPCTVSEVTRSADFTINFSNCPIQPILLDDTSTLSPFVITLQNPMDGGAYLIRLKQGTNPATVTWPASVKWPGGTPPTLSTNSGDVDVISLVYFADVGHYYAVASLGLA